ncbi:TonB-dependent receptor [Petrimonas sp.]|uniref:TonB-dependent receptor n=1 Tax=Petrimonas sp. TaxID=2023866 RepID=UPI003F5103D0
MKKIVLVAAFAVCFLLSYSQPVTFKGYVCDALTRESLPGAAIIMQPNEITAVSDKDGNFQIISPKDQKYSLRISFVGYEPFSEDIYLNSDTAIHFHLQPVYLSLNEVVVSGKNGNNALPSAISAKTINRSFFLKNNSASFSGSLAKLPGISSMDIGSGASKPVIRGLGFNRVAVSDKGIVQQNQQWGADHGLDIDQYDADRVLIHKGPMSLFFGSDAVGGVIELLPVDVPGENMAWGDIALIAKSNNSLLGISAMTSVKHENWFFRGRLTAQTFADYRVPTDTVTYLTWKMPIHNRRLKNTAGRELNASFSVNYSKGNADSWTHVSNIFSKNGFFPGSHGIPDLNRLIPDNNRFNIEFPYSTSNHFKVSNTTKIDFNSALLHFDVGFQQNRRTEMSEFHTHYGNQNAPESNPDMELSFLLNTVSANVKMVFDKTPRWTKTVGISTEMQQNNVGGYSFFMPYFERITAGVFAASQYTINPDLALTGGLRYDLGRLNVEGFYDNTLADYLQLSGYDEADARFYAQRADALKKNFGAMSGAVGLVYDLNRANTFKVNIGRSFRFPSANELASNGVHHGAFRHEKGNNELSPETGWQFDLDYSLKLNRMNFSLNQFTTYFSNFIYLNPTGEWSVLPHAGQIYKYTQSRVFFTGVEAEIAYRLAENLLLSSGFEYVYNRNLDNGYPLPFSPPAHLLTSLTYSDHGKGALMQYSVSVEHQAVIAQNRISTNEEKTPGASLFNLLCSMNWKINNIRFFTDFQIRNVFDTPFYNHLSFYRKLNVPEPGRNVQVILKIPF